MFSPFGTLAWFSEKMGAVQPDWPALTEITGFPVYDREGPRDSLESGLEPGLRRFLAEGSAPIVFTLGSAAVVDARDFYEESRKAVAKVGCRAVFVVGRNSPLVASGAQRGDIFVTGYAPFSELFPLVAAVVHQGGIGTTGQALAAGVPMLVVPLGLDQPDNAARAARLGVARVLPRKRYRAEAAAVHLQALLSGPGYAAVASRIGAQLRMEDGVAAACSAIERILYGDQKTLVLAGVARASLRETPVPAFAGSQVASQGILKRKR
jgi:rhamnosyltransferase subunit B